TISKISRKNDHKNTGVILVLHSYETAFALAACISDFGKLRGVILKNSTNTRFPEVGKVLTSANVPVLNLTKDDMKENAKTVIREIESIIPLDESFILMDHGGYFAYNRDILKHFSAERLVGVAEHTLNGEERYRSLNISDRPIVSIGRSNLKLASDIAAADAILLASDGFLQAGGLNLNNPILKIGVIGCGTLGNRIAQQLISKNAARVFVHDACASKLAGMKGPTPTDKDTICRKCDIIFCATGNKAIDKDQYSLLKNNTIIFNVTSPDDELGIDILIKEKTLIPVPDKQRGETYVYKIASTENEIILPFNGESPNTTMPYGITDPTIHQTYAAHIAAAMSLTFSRGCPNGLTSLKHEFEQIVAQSWMKHYNSKPTKIGKLKREKGRAASTPFYGRLALAGNAL
ncbi:MAG: hypothetical protein HGB11_13335, partial [Chlorobiales bacterium]|nr:hypothetical protein [Chlorobiales bacterium]